MAQQFGPGSSWTSKRLIYQAVENNEQHKDWIYNRTQANPSIVMMTEISKVKPLARDSMDEWIKGNQKNCLLCALACLPPGSPDLLAADLEAWNPEPDDIATRAKKPPQPKPVPIGLLFLTGFSVNTSQHRNTTIGVIMVEGYQGKGFGTEAITWLTDWAFNFGGMHSVRIGCFTFNEGARRLYERLGFVVEGVKRENVFVNGGWHGEVVMSMLENEWRALRAK